MSAKNKEKAALTTEEPEDEYSGSLVYNMWVENMTINVHDGGRVILQTGRPKDPKPPGGGG